MSTNTTVSVRVDEHLKTRAALVLAKMGLTTPDVFRMLLTRIVRDKALPFEPLVPNKKTIAAMKSARRGDLVAVGGIENLLKSLNADD